MPTVWSDKYNLSKVLSLKITHRIHGLFFPVWYRLRIKLLYNIYLHSFCTMCPYNGPCKYFLHTGCAILSKFGQNRALKRCAHTLLFSWVYIMTCVQYNTINVLFMFWVIFLKSLLIYFIIMIDVPSPQHLYAPP